MARIVLALLIISALWIQLVNCSEFFKILTPICNSSHLIKINLVYHFSVKCYVQICRPGEEEGQGIVCQSQGEGPNAKEGSVYEDDIGCFENRQIRDGKLWDYWRETVHREGKEHLTKEDVKEGCEIAKDNEFDWTFENCYCFTDFCNTKYPIPEGATFPPKED